jgi:N-acetylglucosaminyl-diphospho-decaprenol L-rhamnosyltransferase
MGQASPPSNKPLVTLSIVSHGDAEKVARLLESLRSCEQNSQFRVILTDNLGDNLPAFDSSAGASFTILRNQRPCGFACNHNQAFRLVETSYFCILNPDVLFEQEVFGHLIALLETDKADIVAPLIVDSNAVVQDSFRALPTPLDIVRRKLPGYRFVPIPPDADDLVRPDWMAGILLLLKSETYRKLNGFDDRYRFYFEDVEFCTRARLAGLKLLVDTGVRIQHDARRASRKSIRYLLWHIQSAFRFYTSPVYKQALRNKSSSTVKYQRFTKV